MSSDLKDFLKKEVFFKDSIEEKIVQFRLTEQGKYQNGLVKVLMKELITLVFVEDGQVREKTFTAIEATKLFNATSYNNKYYDVNYSTTLAAGTPFYIKCSKYVGHALFMKLQSESFWFANIEPTRNEVTSNWIDVNEILDEKATGEVWERT